MQSGLDEDEYRKENLRYRLDLLQQIAAGLNVNDRHPIAVLQVVLQGGEQGRFEFGVAQALDVIANDLYWDERGDWSDACVAVVEVL